MKRLLIAQSLHALMKQERSFMDRGDTQVLVAPTSEGMLELSRSGGIDLVITRLELPGMAVEVFCNRLRTDRDHGAVPVLMVCANDPAAIKACGRAAQTWYCLSRSRPRCSSPRRASSCISPSGKRSGYP